MWKTLSKLTVTLLLIVVLVTAPVLAEPEAPGTSLPTGEAGIKGKALDAAGDGLEGLKIIISTIENPAVTRSTLTDSKGEYEIEGLAHGYYRVSFEYGGDAYPANRVVMLTPGKTSKASFMLGAIEPADESLGIVAGKQDPLVNRSIGGVARLVERTGPAGLAWLRTGKGVATLVGSGALLIGGMIALGSSSSDEPVVSPSSP